MFGDTHPVECSLSIHPCLYTYLLIYIHAYFAHQDQLDFGFGDTRPVEYAYDRESSYILDPDAEVCARVYAHV